jgi:hypothetical protein
MREYPGLLGFPAIPLPAMLFAVYYYSLAAGRNDRPCSFVKDSSEFRRGDSPALGIALNTSKKFRAKRGGQFAMCSSCGKFSVR